MSDKANQYRDSQISPDYPGQIDEVQHEHLEAVKKEQVAILELRNIQSSIDKLKKKISEMTDMSSTADYNAVSDAEANEDAINDLKDQIDNLEIEKAVVLEKITQLKKNRATAKEITNALQAARSAEVSDQQAQEERRAAQSLSDKLDAEAEAARARAVAAQESAKAAKRVRQSTAPVMSKKLQRFIRDELPHYNQFIQRIVWEAHALTEIEIHPTEESPLDASGYDDSGVTPDKVLALAKAHVENGIVIAEETVRVGQLLREIYQSPSGNATDIVYSWLNTLTDDKEGTSAAGKNKSAVSINADRNARNTLISAEIALMTLFSYTLMSDNNPFFKGDGDTSQIAKNLSDVIFTVAFAGGRALGVMYASSHAETRENRGQGSLGWRTLAIGALIANAAIAAWEANDTLNKADLENAQERMAEINQAILEREQELINQREIIQTRINDYQNQIIEFSRPEIPPEVSEAESQSREIASQLGVLTSMYAQDGRPDLGLGGYNTQSKPDSELTNEMKEVLKELELPSDSYPTEAQVDQKIAELKNILETLNAKIGRFSATFASSDIPSVNEPAIAELRKAMQNDIERLGELNDQDLTLLELQNGLKDAQQSAADSRPGEGWAKYFPNPVNAGLGGAVGATIALLSYVAGTMDASSKRKSLALAGYPVSPERNVETGLDRVFGKLSAGEVSAEEKLIHEHAARIILDKIQDPERGEEFILKAVGETISDIEGDALTALGKARENGLITPRAFHHMTTQVCHATQGAQQLIRRPDSQNMVLRPHEIPMK